NLTDANLEYADSMGAIPVPSLGITKVDAPFSGFGNITLVGDKNLVDPGQGVPVFDRDAWTARFPSFNYKKVRAAKADAFYERMKPAKDLADDGGQFLSMLWEEMRNASVQSPDKIADLFTRYDAPKVYYLRNVLEKNFKVPMRDYKPSVELAADSKVMAYYKANRAAVEGFDSVSAEDQA
ncbi:hypothetical protein RZS08_09570, partial [Arthrospira platensis SPKY1]|nr:hypothetical protein [Arthrospira platensis SPKY1]